MIYCIDIDNTICRAIGRKYPDAIPHTEVIQKIQSLYAGGHTIILHTARGMLTHSGSVESAEKELRCDLTVWLDKHGVPYTELIFGKPYADVYIDDKSLRPTEWMATNV